MTAQSRYDVIVVGAGLAGMFAGALAARRGARTLVIARGLGGTHLGPGTVDVRGYDGARRLVNNPEAEINQKPGQRHPSMLAGLPALREALAEFQKMCAAAGYPLIGALDENFFLPTAMGAVRPTCLAPESFAAGEVRQTGELALARLPGFRDFFADLVAANLSAAGYPARVVSLDLLDAPIRRDSFATDLARLFDDPGYREKVAHHWRAALKGVTRLGLPAILGLRETDGAWRDLRARLDIELFEIPILPPSVPGMRLFNILKKTLEAAGGRVTIGPGIKGWVNADHTSQSRMQAARTVAARTTTARIAAGVIAETAGGPRYYAARHIILATGSFRHGGLEAPTKGKIIETVFGLPVMTNEEWFAPLYSEAQPYARFGVRVNEKMQPVNEAGEVIYENVFAVGGLLAGADRNGEGSREGIDLATAWAAISNL